jgi:hypothetical protein
MSDSPLSLPSDSGSDLVSSLQRLRVRGLASYFEDMEKTAAFRPSRSSATLVHEGVKNDEFDSIVKEDDKIEEVEEVEEAKEVEQAEEVEQVEQVEAFEGVEEFEEVEKGEEFEEFEEVEADEDDDWEEMTMSDIIQK